jgi:hypothetical protein
MGKAKVEISLRIYRHGWVNKVPMDLKEYDSVVWAGLIWLR